MFSPNVIAWATLIGTGLSVVGVGIAIAQIRKTGRAAAAAALAAQAATKAISANVLLSDISTGIRMLEEVKAHVRSGLWEAAVLRLSDARSSLVQLRTISTDEELRGSLQAVIAQLSVLSDVLEEVQTGGPEVMDRIQVMRSLGTAADTLNEWLGQAKYLLVEEQQ